VQKQGWQLRGPGITAPVLTKLNIVWEFGRWIFWRYSENW
jgi:hypothetical protein